MATNATDTLRHATLEDIPYIIKMGQNLYKDAGKTYQAFEVDLPRTKEMLEKFIIEGQENFLVLISHDKGTPVGAVAGYVFQPLFSRQRIATEVLLWLEPEYRTTQRGNELLDAYEYWAKLVGASLAQYGLLSSADPRLGKLYERRGAYPAEVTYYKELK